MLKEALHFRAVRTRTHDEFRRRADECRRLAAAARNARDRAFWLGLVERWQALESQQRQALESRQAFSSLPPPITPSARAGASRRRIEGSLPTPQASFEPRRTATPFDALAGNQRRKA